MITPWDGSLSRTSRFHRPQSFHLMARPGSTDGRARRSRFSIHISARSLARTHTWIRLVPQASAGRPADQASNATADSRGANSREKECHHRQGRANNRRSVLHNFEQTADPTCTSCIAIIPFVESNFRNVRQRIPLHYRQSVWIVVPRI